MNKYSLPQIQKLSPYNPPLDGRRAYPGLLLNFNERTIPVAEKVRSKIRAFVDEGSMQIYPEYGDLCSKISNYAEVEKDQVMITNGSDQGIDLIFRTFTSKGDKVIIPSPSFAMFYQSAEVVGNKVVKPSYEKNGMMKFPLEEVLSEIDEETKLVVICNPNNPTGTLISVDEIEQITISARQVGAIVYVDEAYYEFSKVTASGLIDKYDNLIITRTFSKAFGLASLRIGYVLACKELIDELLKVRGPYDVNMIAAIGADEALNCLDDLNEYVDEVILEAKPIVESFLAEKSVKFFESGGNFILFEEGPDFNSKMLKKNGALIRPRKKGLARLTIGTVSQMKKLLNFIS